MPPKKVGKEKENVNVGGNNEKPLEEHSVGELREMLEKMKMDSSGKKGVLIERIMERYERKKKRKRKSVKLLTVATVERSPS